MSYSLDDKLVIAIASSALFDLVASDAVYKEQGIAEYRKYQRDHEKDILNRGVAFPLVKRLLALNGTSTDERIVEVVLFSRNDPDTGLRVMNSIKHHGLDITRAVFAGGRDPCEYLVAFNVALFLSANETDVKGAIMQRNFFARNTSKLQFHTRLGRCTVSSPRWRESNGWRRPRHPKDPITNRESESPLLLLETLRHTSEWLRVCVNGASRLTK